jgi:hypothetical protein
MHVHPGVLISAAAALALLGACGGKVYLDPPGAGGEGGGGAPSANASSSSSSGTAGGCDAMIEAHAAKVEAAQACNPAVSSIQCSGATIVLDACGCQVLANDKTPEAAKAANASYEALDQAGCSLECEICDPIGPGFCAPAPNGSSGVCAVALPD